MQLMECPGSLEYPHTRAWWGWIFIGRLSLPWKVPHFLCKLVTMHSLHSFRPFWKQARGFWWSQSPNTYAHFSGFIPCLCWVVFLCRSQKKDVCPRKVLPCPIRPLPQPHPILTVCSYQPLAVTTNNLWVIPQLSRYQCLINTHWSLIFWASAVTEHAYIQNKSEARPLYPLTTVHPILASLT